MWGFERAKPMTTELLFIKEKIFRNKGSSNMVRIRDFHKVAVNNHNRARRRIAAEYLIFLKKSKQLSMRATLRNSLIK